MWSLPLLLCLLGAPSKALAEKAALEKPGGTDHLFRASQNELRRSLCGPLCLSFAGKWLGHDIPVKRAAASANWCLSPVSLLDLKRAAEDAGLRCRAVEAAPQKLIGMLSHRDVVAIGSFRQGHFEILLGVDRKRARLIDPSGRTGKFVDAASDELSYASGLPVLLLSTKPHVDCRIIGGGLAILLGALLCLAHLRRTAREARKKRRG